VTLWKEYDFLQDFFDSSVVGRISPKALVIIGGKISFLLGALDSDWKNSCDPMKRKHFL